MRFLLGLISFICFVFISACTPSRLVTPLLQDEVSLTTNFGGPLIGFADTVIPIPLSAVTIAKGVENDLSIYTGLHTTALSYGLIHWDVGLLKQLSTPKKLRPGLSVSPSFNFMLDVWQQKPAFYPSLDINLYWFYPKSGNMSYIGSGNWFELKRTRAYNEPQSNFWITSVHAGHTWIWPRWKLNSEIKFLAPFDNSQYSIVDYKSPSQNGAIGFYVSATYDF